MEKKKLLKRSHYFDFLLVGLLVVAAVAFFIFFFRQTKYVTVTLKVTDKNILYAYTTPPSWFLYLFQQGMREKDGFGRTSAELQDIYFYDSTPTNKAAYLTVKLSTTYNSRTGEYKYKGTTLVVGNGLRMNLGKVLLEGLIVSVEGVKPSYQEIYLNVKARIYGNDPVFPGTTGVDQYIADAVNVGDKVFDSTGKVMAEVTEKQVQPAQITISNYQGNVFLSSDPRKKDIYLTFKVLAYKINNEYYFFYDNRVNVSQVLPIHLKTVSIYPTILKYSQITP